MRATKATRSKDVAANSVGAIPHSQASGATNPEPIAVPTNSNERMAVTGVSDKPALALVKPAERTHAIWSTSASATSRAPTTTSCMPRSSTPTTPGTPSGIRAGRRTCSSLRLSVASRCTAARAPTTMPPVSRPLRSRWRATSRTATSSRPTPSPNWPRDWASTPTRCRPRTTATTSSSRGCAHGCGRPG